MNPEIILSKPCKNPLHMYPHDILPGKGLKPLELLGYCGVCSNLAFNSNTSPNTPIGIRNKPSYPDSKINRKSGTCSNDTL